MNSYIYSSSWIYCLNATAHLCEKTLFVFVIQFIEFNVILEEPLAPRVHAFNFWCDAKCTSSKTSPFLMSTFDSLGGHSSALHSHEWNLNVVFLTERTRVYVSVTLHSWFLFRTIKSIYLSIQLQRVNNFGIFQDGVVWKKNLNRVALMTPHSRITMRSSISTQF